MQISAPSQSWLLMSWGWLSGKPQLPLGTLLASTAILGAPGMALTRGEGTAAEMGSR